MPSLARCLISAITLAPEVDAAAASQMHHALMVAVGDAIGALALPEVVVTYQFPGTLLFNRGIAGAIRLVQGPLAADQKTPSWMVVSARLRLSGEMQAMPLEFRMANTSLKKKAPALSHAPACLRPAAGIFWSGCINGKRRLPACS